MKIFRKDEASYLEWVESNRGSGFILNVDDPQSVPDYPKLHLARYKCVTSPTTENYTSNTYFKVCSQSISELESWSLKTYGKPATPCRGCFR